MPRVLFICAGNAVRSQMAEGWARRLAGDRIEVTSAGIDAGGVHPQAVAAMAEVGVDISEQGSRRISDKLLGWADHIITLADSVRPYIVYFPETARHRHWSIANPDAMFGPDLTTEKAYALVRDELKRRIERFLETVVGTNATE